MRVIEIGSGGGYYSELLSRVVGDDGFVYAHNPYVFLKLAGDQLTGRYGNGTLRNVGLVFGSLPQLALPAGTLDGAYLIDIYHDISFDDETGEAMSDQAVETLREAYRLLKPGGLVGVIDHRARKGSTRADAATVHRIPEHMVRRDFQDAGFVFEANTELLRNAADDGSRAWFSDSALKDATDRMVLRFRKPGRVADASTSFDASFSYVVTNSKEI
jgi:predicted methyltransferase